MAKTFAPGYPRNEQGWILFPRDTQERKGLFFPPEVNEHPAKMNLHLEQSIIEYVAEPGQILLDPFGGTGSLMIAALQGMNVVLLEIEDSYHLLQLKALSQLQREDKEAASRVMLLKGDNRLLLPIPCHHIITSPPYASMMHVDKPTKRMIERPDDSFSKMDKQMMEYTKSQRNIGRLNNFLYNQAMENVYRLCAKSLLPGGTLTIILKDRIENNQRVYLTGWADRVCSRLGLTLILREKWKTPGIQHTATNKLHGLEVVEDEDIMVYRKEN
jgi:DNA modification methylase